VNTASLKLSQSADLPGQFDRVWAILTDPNIVVSCVPGAAITATHEDGSLDGSLVSKLGPTTVQFRGTVALQFDHETRVARLEARGGDAGGRTKASATISCSATSSEEASHTTIEIDALLNVSGGLAAFARTGGMHVARRMLLEFSTNLSDLVAQQAGTAGNDAKIGPGPAKSLNGARLLAHALLDALRGGFRNVLHRLKTEKDRRNR